MRLAQHLLSNRFYKSLFYLLPLVFFTFLIYYLFYEATYYKNTKTKNTHLVKVEKSIKLFDFSLDLEKYIKANGTVIKNLKIMPKSVIFQLEGELVKSLEIIEFIENFSSQLDIKKLNFKVIPNNKIDLNFEIELKKIKTYYKKQNLEQITNNVLYQKSEQSVKNNKEQITIKLDAIIGDQVLIADKWYKVGSLLNNQKIVAIKNDHIVLEQQGQINNIWMYKNEFTR